MGRLELLEDIDQLVVDSRLISSDKSIFFAINQGCRYIDDALCRGAKYIVTELEDIQGDNIIHVSSSLLALQDFAYKIRQKRSAKVIAVTGSRGKTVVKDLLRDMLATTYNTYASPESFNSQIGVALSLFGISPEHQYAIIEAGASSPGEMERLSKIITPNSVIITNIMDDHAATLIDVLGEKRKLIENGMKKEWALVPLEELSFYNSESVYSSSSIKSEINEKYNWLQYRFYLGEDYVAGAVPKQYAFLLDNIKVASFAAYLEGVPVENIQSVLDVYVFENNRTEIWRSPLGITYINEPYFQDTFSFGASFNRLRDVYSKGRKIFFLHTGGCDTRHLNYDYFIQLLMEYEVGILIFDDVRLAKLIRESAFTGEMLYCKSFHDGLEKITNISRRGDFVLIKGLRKVSLENIGAYFSEIIGDSRLYIDLDAMADNLERIKAFTGSAIMPMLKASAYGTDSAIVGRYLQNKGYRIIGVAHVNEAVIMRQEGFLKSILVLNAGDKDIAQVFKYNLELVVSDSDLIVRIAEEALQYKKNVKLHLNVDTGMGRLGCRIEEALHLAKLIDSADYLVLEGVMTHFAAADDGSKDAFTLKQQRSFQVFLKELVVNNIKPNWTHCYNSSASMRFRIEEDNLSRIGLAMYGIHPSDASINNLKLTPVLSLRSRIIQLKSYFKGENISYGCTYTVQSEREDIAIIPLGYFDGISRKYSSQISLLINGVRAPVVGAICMDFMMVNVSDVDDVKVGDEVVLFGLDDYDNYIPPEDFALAGGSIAYELMTSMGTRVQRLFYN